MAKCELCSNGCDLIRCVNCETLFCKDCGDISRELCEDCVAYNEVNDNIELDDL